MLAISATAYIWPDELKGTEESLEMPSISAHRIFAVPELLAAVFDHLDDLSPGDKAHLAGLARVCTAFRGPATEQLYRRLQFNHPKSQGKLRGQPFLLIETLSRNPALGQLVQVVYSYQVFTRILDDLLALVPNLRTLVWEPQLLAGWNRGGDCLGNVPSGVALLCVHALYTDLPKELLRPVYAQLTQLSRLEVELSWQDLVLAVEACGLQLSKLTIRWHDALHVGRRSAGDWDGLFALTPHLQHLIITFSIPFTTRPALPASLRRLELHSVSPYTSLGLLHNLANPLWLPSLAEVPAIHANNDRLVGATRRQPQEIQNRLELAYAGLQIRIGSGLVRQASWKAFQREVWKSFS